jgi:hypothetical protein
MESKELLLIVAISIITMFLINKIIPKNKVEKYLNEVQIPTESPSPTEIPNYSEENNELLPPFTDEITHDELNKLMVKKNNEYINAISNLKKCEKGGRGAKNSCKEAINLFKENQEMYLNEKNKIKKKIINLIEASEQKEMTLEQKQQYLKKLTHQIAISKANAEKKVSKINKKINEDEIRYWNDANLFWSCPGASDCVLKDNGEAETLYNPCTSEPKCFCNGEQVNIDTIVGVNETIDTNQWQCPSNYKNAINMPVAPKCIGLSSVGTTEDGKNISPDCANGTEFCLDDNYSCIQQFNNAIKDLKTKGEILYQYSIPKNRPGYAYGKGKQFDCDEGLYWEGPDQNNKLKGDKRIRTGIIPGCKGWKCDLTSMLNPNQYKGSPTARGPIFTNVEILDGKVDPKTKIRRPGPFKTEPSCKIRFPKNINESADSLPIPNKYSDRKDTMPVRREIYKSNDVFGPIPDVINNRNAVSGWDTTLYEIPSSEDGLPKKVENDDYNKHRPLHDPDNIIPEHIVSRNLKKVIHPVTNEVGTVCDWYFDENDYGVNVNTTGKKKNWIPMGDARQIQIEGADTSDQSLTQYSLYEQNAGFILNSWGENINNDNLHNTDNKDDKNYAKRCYSRFCENLANKWGGSIWRFSDAEKGYGPKQSSRIKKSNGKYDINKVNPMRFFGQKNKDTLTLPEIPIINFNNLSDADETEDYFYYKEKYALNSIVEQENNNGNIVIDLDKISNFSILSSEVPKSKYPESIRDILFDYNEKNAKIFTFENKEYNVQDVEFRGVRALGSYIPDRIGIFSSSNSTPTPTPTPTSTPTNSNYDNLKEIMGYYKGVRDSYGIDTSATGYEIFIKNQVNIEINLAKKLYRQLCVALNPPLNINNRGNGWMTGKNYNDSDIVSILNGDKDNDLPTEIIIGNIPQEACNCVANESTLNLSNAKKLLSLEHPDCAECHPSWNSTTNEWEHPQNNSKCPTKCGGKGVLYIDPESSIKESERTYPVKYFVSSEQSKNLPLQCNPSIMYDPNPNQWRKESEQVSETQIPAKKLMFLPPEQYGFDTIGAMNEYCTYTSEETVDDNNTNTQQPNIDWYSNEEFPTYPGSCFGINKQTTETEIPLTGGDKDNTCGKSIMQFDSNINENIVKADNLGLKGKEPKCCQYFIGKGNLEGDDRYFKKPEIPFGPNDYTANREVVSSSRFFESGKQVTYFEDEDNSSHSKIVSPGSNKNDNEYIWKPSYFQRIKTDYKFTKKDSNGNEKPLNITELVSKTSKSGLKSLGNVFLNEHGLIVNSNGKCCDPSLYSETDENSIKGSCGFNCNETNLIEPIDNINNSSEDWQPENNCTYTGFKKIGSRNLSNCMEYATSNNNNRDANQIKSWLMTRIPNNNSPVRPGQIRTCVNTNISNNISNNLIQINKSKKILDGTQVDETNFVDRRINGKYGLSEIMGNMLDKEYLRIKKKEVNRIKAAAKIGKKI